MSAGNTFCLPEGGGRGGARAVLVVGHTLTCHFWLNVLPLVRDPLLRYFITVEDLQALGSRLYVRPTLLPSFLVLDGEGYPVDWFPAPLPAAGTAADPAALAAAVRRQLALYPPPTATATRWGARSA